MIHVQIASELTADGVRGVRWVLLEAAEPLPPEAVAAPTDTVPASLGPTTVAPAARATEVAPDSVADSLRLRALKALVVALGLGAALWTAAVQIGPPGRAVPAAPGPASTAMPLAPDTASRPMPTLPRTQPAASSAMPRAPALPAPPAGPAAPRSALDTPTSVPAAAPEQPAAPASAGLPRLTASL